jgi:hypothetical protein
MMLNKELMTSTDYDFSIINGGMFDHFLKLIGVNKTGSKSTLRKIIFYTGLTWIPLAILTAIEGSFWGNHVDVPFINEFATHIRLLLAIWILVLAEGIVDKRVKYSVNQFNKSGILSESGKEKFERAKIIADRMCESYWAEGIILFLIIVNLIFRITINTIDLTTWILPDKNNTSTMSLAGYWALIISFPVFQFIILRWFWRWIIWLRLLFLIAKVDLQLLPTHPDKSGGLGFLGESPLPFGIFTFVLSIVFSGMLAERVVFLEEVLQEQYLLIAVFVLFCVIINMVPLLPFIGPLISARSKGISNYHAMIAHHHREFENKWLTQKTQNKESLLGHTDASSAADISAVYELAENMTIFPFNLKTMAVTVLISIVPIISVFAIQLPMAEMLKMLAGLLL